MQASPALLNELRMRIEQLERSVAEVRGELRVLNAIKDLKQGDGIDWGSLLERVKELETKAELRGDAGLEQDSIRGKS